MSEVQSTLRSQGFNFDRNPERNGTQHIGLNWNLHLILSDVKCVTRLINNLQPGQILRFEIFLEIILSVCSRLISFHPLNSPKKLPRVEAVYHIGLTIFMMTLFLQHEGRQIMKFDLVFTRLKDILDGELDDLDDRLVLWLLIIGSIWTSGGTDGSWLIEKLRLTAQRMNLKNWEEVRDCLSAYPWVKMVHDRPGRVVWKRAV